MSKTAYTRTATIGGIRYTFCSSPPVWLWDKDARSLWMESETEMSILNARAYVARAGGYQETAERYAAQAADSPKLLALLSNYGWY